MSRNALGALFAESEQTRPKNMEELLGSARLLLPMLDAIPNAVIFIKDTQARYAFVNQTLARRCGFKHTRELLGLTAEHVFPERFGPLYTEQVEPVVLAKLVQEVVLPFQDSLNERHGQLQVAVPDHLQVLADPNGLAMVLRNLVDNALKFTPADRAPEIRIEAHEQDGTVHLQVADRGMGFDMKHHDRVFGMFQRLHRQDQIPGTGIGLAMAHKAVERMGGRIWAHSTPGQGTTFHLELPQG